MIERAHHTALFLFCGMVGATVFFYTTNNSADRIVRHRLRPAPSCRADLLAFGDVNLGRSLGQRILKDEVHYPFEKMAGDSADIYFVNLESTLSEQQGETESPGSNYVFTGPPAGAQTLSGAGITCVATANNHAYDYGEQAALETLDHLDAANIAHIGTAKTGDHVFEPLWIERNGIRFALFAVTDFMNIGGAWRTHVASTDSALLFPKIREAAVLADAIVVSVHGGNEYAEVPSERMEAFMHACVKQGASLVLGHHPHVSYGIEKVDGRFIVASLGNYVFSQPQNEWTQLSYGVLFSFSKKDGTTTVSLKRIIPIDVGFQPSRISDAGVREKLFARTQRYSTIPLTEFH